MTRPYVASRARLSRPATHGLCPHTSLGTSGPQNPGDGKPAGRGQSLFSLGTRVAPAPVSAGT